jgi:hypothetical protein
MGEHGAVYQPELVKLMKAVLRGCCRDASGIEANVGDDGRNSFRILACAAKGERDPAKLRGAAMLAVVDCTHYSHNISPERRVV